MADRKDPDVARAERSGHGAAKWIVIIAVVMVVVFVVAISFGGGGSDVDTAPAGFTD